MERGRERKLRQREWGGRERDGEKRERKTERGKERDGGRDLMFLPY